MTKRYGENLDFQVLNAAEGTFQVKVFPLSFTEFLETCFFYPL